MSTLQDLAAHPMWNYFFELSAVPRPSKHEEKAREWVLALAKKWKLAHKADGFGNIVLLVPANDPARASSPAIAIQSHLDMVCEKDEGIVHDFFSDPLALRIATDAEGEWVTATGTTLGADNGIAVAMAIALADPACAAPHGPLELLFTLDEETGLNGAANLGPGMISAKYLLNIDNAQEGVLCVGCAGGRDFIASLPLRRRPLSMREKSPLLLTVRGLVGGHSGMEIFDGRSNALKILEQALSSLVARHPDAALLHLHGGEKRNAIPRFAQGALALPSAEFAAAEKLIATLRDEMRTTLTPADAQAFSLDLTPYEASRASNSLRDFFDARGGASSDSTEAFEPASLEHVLRALRLCPHGPLQRTGLTGDDTSLSNNLASVRTADEYIEIVNNSRFSFPYQDAFMRRLFADVFAETGAAIDTDNGYEAWSRAASSRLQDVFTEVYRRRSGQQPIVRVVHAGLECGLLKQRVSAGGGPELDIISIGPEIRFLHSPLEKLNVASAGRTWDLLCDLLISI